MKTRKIILRTSGAIVLALTMVLIPLSQAEAGPTVPCSIEPGTTARFCGSRYYTCERIETSSYILKKHLYITRHRPTQEPYCYQMLECGGCYSLKIKKRWR